MTVAKSAFSPPSSYNVERGCVFLLWIGREADPKATFFVTARLSLRDI
jgi:hypothetical protein